MYKLSLEECTKIIYEALKKPNIAPVNKYVCKDTAISKIKH